MNWGAMSRAERDAAYNNTDAVKNSNELNEARIAASGETRRTASSGISANNTQMARPSPMARKMASQAV